MEQVDVRHLIDVERLQRMEDRLAAATGLAMITVDYRGVPVTEASNFTAFCAAIRADPERRRGCFKCDAHGGLQSAIEGRPYIYTCHTGLVDISVPIMLGDQYVGAILAGQVQPTWDSGITRLLPEDDSWRDYELLTSLREQIPTADAEKLDNVAHALFEMASYLVEKEFPNRFRAALQEGTSAMGGVGPVLQAVGDATLPAGLAVPQESTSAAATPPPPPPLPKDGPMDFTLLGTAMDALDLVTAVNALHAALKQALEGQGKFVRRLRLADIENNLVLMAQESSAQAVMDLQQRVLRHRAVPYAHVNRFDWHVYLEGLLFALFDTLNKQAPPRQRTLDALLNHVERNIDRAPTLTKAAELVSMSASHLSRTFKAHTGVTYGNYVNNKRLDRAKFMLEHSDLPVLKIADMLGFRPLNYFSRVFKRHTGSTPTEFRARVRERATS